MKNKWWELPAVSLLILALAIVSTYPLALYFDTGIPFAATGGGKVWNRSGDQMQLLYWFWLVKENLMGTIPFDSNPFEFNMAVPHASAGLNSIPLSFLYMFFSPLGDVTAYNCSIISTYLLTGLFMYLLVRLYSGSRAGALLAAVIFTFAPSRINGFTAGHGYGFLFFTYPFILYFLEKGIRTRKIRYGVLAAIGVKGLSMLEPHLIYYLSVFLGIYIPIRILFLFPLYHEGAQPRILALPPVFSLIQRLPRFFIWCAGLSVVLYVQVVFVRRYNDPFFSTSFWWGVTLYPVIPLLFSIALASLYQRVSGLSFKEGLVVEAVSLLPVMLLMTVLCFMQPIDTFLLICVSLVLWGGCKIVLLRHHLLSMLKVLCSGLWGEWRSVLSVVPVILTMGSIVLWMGTTKVKQISSTVAAGGRTLSDVGLFSAQLSDVLRSTSNVYVGIVPALVFGGLLIAMLFTVRVQKQQEKLSDETGAIAFFYLIVAYCCFLLALGLAFGRSSLYILLYHYFPFFSYPRVSDRIITMVLFALAVLAGFVVRSFQDRCTNRVAQRTVFVLVLAAIGVQLKDYNTFKPMGINILDKGQDIYTHVQKNVGDGLLLELPLWPGDSHQSSLYQHYIMLDRVRRVNGCSPLVLTQYIDTVYTPLVGLNRGKIGRKQYKLLQDLNVKFITVHDTEDVFTKKVSPYGPLTTVRRLKNSPYLEHVDIENSMYFKTWKGVNHNLYLFRVKDDVEPVKENSVSLWYTMPSFYDAANRLYHQTGRVVEDSEIGRKVFLAGTGDNPGFLVYGPYVIHPPGSYRSTFTINAENFGEKPVARLEVVETKRNGDMLVLNQREIQGDETSAGYQKIPLEFSLEKNTNLEFRVFYYGKGSVKVERVVVTRDGHNASIYSLEAEKMVGDVGQLEFVKDASGGKVIESVRGRKKGDMVYGPNRLYPSGSYRARFYLRLKKPVRGKGVAAVVSVTDARNMSVYQQRKVQVAELNSKEFTAIDLNYMLNRDDELSFHVRFTGKQSIQLDRIEIQQKSVLSPLFLLDD